MALFRQKCEDNNMMWRMEDCFRYLHEFPQRYNQLDLMQFME